MWPRDCAATPKGAGKVGEEVGRGTNSRAASHFSSAEIAGSAHIDETNRKQKAEEPAAAAVDDEGRRRWQILTKTTTRSKEQGTMQPQTT